MLRKIPHWEHWECQMTPPPPRHVHPWPSLQGGHLVESRRPREDDVGILDLDHSLAQPHEVGPDPEGPAGHLWRQDPSCNPWGQGPATHSGDGPGTAEHAWKPSLATGILIGGRTARAQACPSGCLTSTSCPERMGLARKSVVKTHGRRAMFWLLL